MKKWYKSKTLWFNLLSAIVPVLETQFTLFSGSFGESATQIYIVSIIVGNIMLRFVTEHKLQ
jgi:hypothetical protein